MYKQNNPWVHEIWYFEGQFIFIFIFKIGFFPGTSDCISSMAYFPVQFNVQEILIIFDKELIICMQAEETNGFINVYNALSVILMAKLYIFVWTSDNIKYMAYFLIQLIVKESFNIYDRSFVYSWIHHGLKYVILTWFVILNAILFWRLAFFKIYLIASNLLGIFHYSLLSRYTCMN